MKNGDPIRVLLVDDHAVVRAGLQSILSSQPGIVVIGGVSMAAHVPAAVESLKPDVVLLDMRLPDAPGTKVARELKALPNPPRVAMLTSFAEPKEVFAAFEAGVDGYLLKDSDADALIAALIALAHGDQVLHPQITRMVLGGNTGNRPPGRLDALTPSERRILALVTDGRTNKEIGDAMHLSEKTVRNHMTTIMGKLGVERRQQAVALFVQEQAHSR